MKNKYKYLEVHSKKFKFIKKVKEQNHFLHQIKLS